MSSKMIIIAGIAVGVAALAIAVISGTMHQQSYVKEDATLAQAAEQGAFSSASGLGAQLNKEKWHEDPFGDISKKVMEENGYH